MLRLMIAVLIGGGIGTALGYFGKCTSGACPLTANWQRGAVSGALIGMLFCLASGCGGSSAVNASTANVTRISESQFDAQVMQAPMPVVVDFYAAWCGPCRILSPMLDELAQPLTNQVKFVKVNVDEAAQLAQRYNVEGIPTVIFFKNGKAVDRIVGLPARDTLKSKLESLAAAGSASQ